MQKNYVIQALGIEYWNGQNIKPTSFWRHNFSYVE